MVEHPLSKRKVVGSTPTGGSIPFAAVPDDAYLDASKHFENHDSVSEWLRRWTRNPLGSARAGSNPAAVVFVSYLT